MQKNPFFSKKKMKFNNQFVRAFGDTQMFKYICENQHLWV